MARKPRTTDRYGGLKFEVPEFYPHVSDAKRRLLEFHDLLRSKGHSEDDLVPYQDTLLAGIEDAIGYPTSNGFRTLLDPGRINPRELIDGHRLRAPRISVRCFLTSKHNLSVTWHTHHLDLDFNEVPAPEWMISPNGINYFERPDDELLFLRGFGTFTHLDHEPRYTSLAVDISLLTMAIAVWNDLKNFIKLHFDVQVIQEPVVRVRDRREFGFEAKTGFSGNEVAVGFEIEHKIETERQRLESVIDNFQKNHSIAAETFWELINDEKYKGNGVNFDKRSRALKKMGADSMHPSVVENVRKDFLKAIEARLWSPSSRVVEFPSGRNSSALP